LCEETFSGSASLPPAFVVVHLVSLPCLPPPRRLWARKWWDNTGAIWVYRAALVSAVTFVAVPELAAAARLKFPHGTDVPKGVWVAAAGLLFKAVSTAVAARMERADA